jgi:outer membrane protein TolC
METSERELQAALAQAHAGFIAAVAKLAVDEEFAAAAQLRAEIARSKYNNGLLSFENWDIIENDLIARQRALLASRRDRVIAEAAWQQAIGQSDLP